MDDLPQWPRHFTSDLLYFIPPKLLHRDWAAKASVQFNQIHVAQFHPGNFNALGIRPPHLPMIRVDQHLPCCINSPVARQLFIPTVFTILSDITPQTPPHRKFGKNFLPTLPHREHGLSFANPSGGVRPDAFIPIHHIFPGFSFSCPRPHRFLLYRGHHFIFEFSAASAFMDS